MSARRRVCRPLALALGIVALTACGSTTHAVTPSVSGSATATRGPVHAVASPVKVALLSPKNDEVITASTVHVAVSLSGGTITPEYSTHVSPTVGHLHLYMNGELVSMNYSTDTDLLVDRGTEYSLYVEWVASDHGSFTPRDVTPKIFFAVSP